MLKVLTMKCKKSHDIDQILQNIPIYSWTILQGTQKYWIHSEWMERLQKCGTKSLAPGRCGDPFQTGITKHMLQARFMSTSYRIALSWLHKMTYDDKSILVQVMAWCHQVTSHCWSYSISLEICIRFLLCCALLWLYIDWFSHIHQAYFTGTVAI